MKRKLQILALVILLASLFTGAVVSGAQAPLTNDYTWEKHGVSLSYPAGWSVVQKDTVLSVRPDGLDVSDGRGPELILFDVPDTHANQLLGAMSQIMSGSGATFNIPITGSLNGYVTLSASMTWRNPDAHGLMTLIALDDDTVIGVAYVVRTGGEAAYLPTLEAMQASMSFGAKAAGVESSESVASVQLPQRYVWEDTGLVLYLPDNWMIELDPTAETETLIATPDPDAVTGDARYHILQATMLEDVVGLDLREAAEASALDYALASNLEDISVNGMDGVTYELRDDSSDPVLHLRPLLLQLPDGRLTLLIFAARDAAWENFRPVVSAMISSIEFNTATSSLLPAGSDDTRALISRTPLDSPALWRQDPPEQFVWEEYGIGFTLPEGWLNYPGDGQEYDIALVSPEAIEGNQQGAFVTIRGFTGLLASDVTLESALQPVADEVGADIEDYTAGGMDGKAIVYTTEDNARRFFILLPYGDRGDAIYLQATTAAGSDSEAVVQGVLDSMTVNPPEPDYAAVDAAWQASLAEQNKLVVGDPDAPVKITEYLSFTCGHCVNYSRSVERLIALEVEEGRVQYEFAALAGDPLATNATHATYCAAEQGKGFTVAEALFQGYLDLGPEEAYSEDGIKELLGDFGLDMDALATCMSDTQYNDSIDTIRTEFNDKGMTGTPTLAMGKGDDPIAPLTLPDGQIWAGAIPLHFVRDIVNQVIEDDIEIADYFNQ